MAHSLAEQFGFDRQHGKPSSFRRIGRQNTAGPALANPENARSGRRTRR